MPMSRCSVEMYSSPICCISFSDCTNAASNWRLGCGCAVVDPLAEGRLVSALRTAVPMALASPPAASMSPRTTPCSWVSRALSRCSTSICALPAADALCTASVMASRDILVSLFWSIAVTSKSLGLPWGCSVRACGVCARACAAVRQAFMSCSDTFNRAIVYSIPKT